MLNNGTAVSLPPRAVLLGQDVVLATLPPGAEDNGLTLFAGGAPPYGSVALHGRAGPLRLAAFRLPAIATAPPPVAVIAGDEDAAAFTLFHDSEIIEHSAAVPASLDPLAMAELLDAASRHRLIDFLLAFCRPAFRLGRDATFAAICARVASACGEPAGAALPVAEVMPNWHLLRGVAARAADAVYVIGRTSVRLNRALATPGEPLALQLVEGAQPGDLLLAVGETVRIWTVAAPVAALPNVLALPGDTDGFAAAARLACRRALARAVPGSAGAALVRELQVLHPARAQVHDDPSLPIGGALELAIPDGEGGIFLRGWLRDPLDLVAEASLIAQGEAQPIPGDALHRVSRPDLQALFAKAAHRDLRPRPGFVAHVRDPSRGACLQPTLRLRLRSGAVVDLVPPLRPLSAATARDVVLSSVPPHEARGAVLRDCLAPAAAALHRQARGDRGEARVRQFGTPVARPSASLLVPLYRNLGFLRFQLAALAADPACRAAEIIFALDSPEQEDEVEHLLRGLHYLHDMPMTLVVMERNGGFSAATNAAARQARSDLLMLLNSDVVPHRPGWLQAMDADRLRAGATAATAKLLFDDGSLQHAGLYFERDADAGWFNRHYHKGMPRRWPGADRPRLVPGGTGAALLVERRAFEAVGGLCEDYVVGDYEDSDLCLRLQAAGGSIWYAPEAELFHFERRSIALHAGYQRTVACQFNRHLHHTRWDGAIAALMAEPDFQPTAAKVAA